MSLRKIDETVRAPLSAHFVVFVLHESLAHPVYTKLSLLISKTIDFIKQAIEFST